MLSSTMNQVLSYILTEGYCVFSEDIGVYESLIFGNTAWKLHTGVRVAFALVDDNNSIVLVTEPQIPVNLKSALVGLAL